MTDHAARTELRGRHVAAMFIAGFALVIAVNLILAWNALHSFPGLEVRNSYVASQSFDADRAAQLALGWDVSARLQGDVLVLEIRQDGQAIAPVILGALFSRATTVAHDQTLAFTFDGTAFRAPVVAGTGNWNLRLEAQAADGTIFRQRVIVRTAP